MYYCWIWRALCSIRGTYVCFVPLQSICMFWFPGGISVFNIHVNEQLHSSLRLNNASHFFPSSICAEPPYNDEGWLYTICIKQIHTKTLPSGQLFLYIRTKGLLVISQTNTATAARRIRWPKEDWKGSF